MKKKIFIAIAVMAIIVCVYLWIRKKRKTSVVNLINDAVSSSGSSAASSSGSSAASSSGSSAASSAFPLKKGVKNKYVKQMQIIVNYLVGDTLTEDGIFGNQTEKFFKKDEIGQDLYSFYNKIYANALNAGIQKGEIGQYIVNKDTALAVAFFQDLYNGKITKEMVEYIRNGKSSGSQNPEDDLLAVMTGNAFSNGIF